MSVTGDVLVGNITFFVIFAVLDVSFAVNSCINRVFYIYYYCYRSYYSWLGNR